VKCENGRSLDEIEAVSLWWLMIEESSEWSWIDLDADSWWGSLGPITTFPANVMAAELTFVLLLATLRTCLLRQTKTDQAS
jgi:hypothetical protein